MSLHNISPTRDQIRAEIMAAVTGGQPKTISALLLECPSAADATEIARLAFELTKKGKLIKGDPVINQQNKAVNTYRLPTPSDHPWKQAVVTPKEAKEPRVTRDLPIHLQTPEPPLVPVEAPVEDLDTALIEAIAQLKEEDDMTEERNVYMTPEEEECMNNAFAKDDDINADAAIEASRLAIVDAMLAYAHDKLRGHRTWLALERAYLAVSGDRLVA